MKIVHIPQSLRWIATGFLVGAAYLLPNEATGAVVTIISAVTLALVYQLETQQRWYHPFLFGLAIYFTGFHWLPKVIETFGEYATISSFGIAAVLYIYSALQFVLLDFFVRGLRRTAFERYQLALPAAWVAAEFLFPQLIPWSLANTLIPFPTLTQLADIGGAPIVTFLLLWWSCLIVSALRLLARRKASAAEVRKRFVLALTLLLVVIVYGRFRINVKSAQIAASKKVSLALVQGNLDPMHDYTSEHKEKVMSRYRNLSQSAIGGNDINIVVWPESSVWNDYAVDQDFISRGSASDPFPGFRSVLLFGGQTSVRQVERGIPKFYNTAFALESSGRLQSYHKQVLFPFSEKVPLSDIFPSLRALVKKNYEFIAGEKQAPLRFRVPHRPELEEIVVAAAICYEDIWPQVFKTAAEQSPISLLIAVTNDAWFLNTLAAEQHHLLASWRAIEQGKFLARDSNSGITAVIDPMGNTLKQLPPLRGGVLIAKDVGLVKEKTFYTGLGRIPIIIFSILVGVVTLANMRRR